MEDNNSKKIIGNFEEKIRSAWNDQWWSMLLGSILLIIFGLLVFFMPGLTIATFVLLFGVFAIAVSVLQLWQAVTIKDGKWWVRLLGCIIALAAGIGVFLWPNISALSLLYVIAFFFILFGILQVISSIELSRVFAGEWLYFICGILSIVVGVMMILNPQTGAIALAQVIGIFAVADGIVLGVFALKLQGTMNKVFGIMDKDSGNAKKVS
ncbi:MAG TPA: HdeD family acid-resistance protein [Methanocella sp.]|uniref:HdeD family acid-resistance protein n=1 Tax=Methanocella sp. TaxID=2052833 RepID=UPI002CC0E468|nr:HdeD family acid-resistance protein [Methanocella sp.]HTY90135.1 HdeD family acid-resistance protein [Methanocella sp.]